MFNPNEDLTEENCVRVGKEIAKMWKADGSLNDFIKMAFPNGIPSSIVSSISNEGSEGESNN